MPASIVNAAPALCSSPRSNNRLLPGGTGRISCPSYFNLPNTHGKLRIRQTLKEGWQYLKMDHPINQSTWIKLVMRNGRTTEAHFGISREGPEEGVAPDAVVVCKLMRRSVTTDWIDIFNVCAGVACCARRHRGGSGSKEYCDCDFEGLKDSKNAAAGHKGYKWDMRFVKWVEGIKVRKYMRKHDRLCSCACFGI